MKNKSNQRNKKAKKVKFKAKVGSRFSDKQAESYGQRVYELMKVKGKTTINPGEVVEDAQNVNTPYHDYFTWDDVEAGKKCRLQEARQLLNSIVIVNEESDENDEPSVPVRAFVYAIDLEGEKGYIPMQIAMASPEMASQVVQNALKEAKAWHEKYKEYQELARIHRAIKEEISSFNIEED